MSIQFDSTELWTSTYTPRNIKHESSPEREINSADLTDEDGSIFISSRYGKKAITIQGILTGSSDSDLESKIDAFKEVISRPEKNLDISWNSTTRRYVATCIEHSFDRDYFHLLFVPYTITFIVLTGEGKATSETTALSASSFGVSSPATKTFSFEGGKPPRPELKITLEAGYPAPASAMGIEIKNSTTGEKIIIIKKSPYSSWGANDYVKINFGLKKIYSTLGGLSTEEELDFYGTFFDFIIGSNSVLISVGGIVNQQTGIDASAGLSGITMTDANIRHAQSFQVPRDDTTFEGISLCLQKVGSPASALAVDLVNDNNGKPTGSTIASFAIPAGEVGVNWAYVAAYATGGEFTLEAGKRYWLVARSGSVDASNYYVWAIAGYDAYKKGFRSFSTNAGSTWTEYTSDDHLFKLLFGGQPNNGSANLLVKYYKTYL